MCAESQTNVSGNMVYGFDSKGFVKFKAPAALALPVVLLKEAVSLLTDRAAVLLPRRPGLPHPVLGLPYRECVLRKLKDHLHRVGNF